MNSEMRQGLLAIYDEAAVEVANAAPVCELSGRCCRFREYGHTLFISRPEAELLLEQGLPAETPIDDGSCPYQIQGLCTARERRPLGCRLYFCDPKYEGVGEQISEKLISRLKTVHNQTETSWEYRPLHFFLREHVNKSESIP